MIRKDADRDLTRAINKVRQILRRHNLQWDTPTKTFSTVAAVVWLKQIVLPEIDRLELNHLLIDLVHVQQRMKELEKVIAQRSGASKEVAILSSIPVWGAVLLPCPWRAGSGGWSDSLVRTAWPIIGA